MGLVLGLPTTLYLTISSPSSSFSSLSLSLYMPSSSLLPSFNWLFDQADPAMEEGRKRLCDWAMIRSLFAILQWWAFNVTVIITNKWIFQVCSSLFDFPLPFWIFLILNFFPDMLFNYKFAHFWTGLVKLSSFSKFKFIIIFFPLYTALVNRTNMIESEIPF